MNQAVSERRLLRQAIKYGRYSNHARKRDTRTAAFVYVLAAMLDITTLSILYWRVV